MNTTTSIQMPCTATRRPPIISLLCILGSISTAINVSQIFSKAAHDVGAWFPVCFGVTEVATALCMIGLWGMQRWAVYLYSTFAVAWALIALQIGAWNPAAQSVRAVFIAIMVSQLSKMR